METNSAQSIHYLASPIAQSFIDRKEDSIRWAVEIARKLQDGTYRAGDQKDDPNILTFGGYTSDTSWLKDGDDGYNDDLLPDIFFVHCNCSPQYDGCPVFFVSQYPYDSGEEFDNAIKEALPLRLP